jgi:hypothetical protein
MSFSTPLLVFRESPQLHLAAADHYTANPHPQAEKRPVERRLSGVSV